MTSYRDWVVETSSTTGTGSYSLSGSPPAGTSYFTFRQRYSNGDDEVIYWVVNADRTKWEKNRFGTLTYGSPDTLSRNVIESTNGDAAVSWVGGDAPLLVYVVPDSEQAEFSIAMGLGTTRPGVLKFGIWADQDALDTGVHQLKLYDGSAETAVGSVNTVGDQAILFGLPPGFIKRTMARGSGAPTTKLDVTFTCMDSTDAVGLKQTSVLTKRTGGSWVAGNDANGMGVALTVANNTWYHVFAVLVDGVVDCYFDTSVSAANKPANTTHFRRLGSIKTDSSAQIVDFLQNDDEFQWTTLVTDLSANAPGTSATPRTLTVPPGVSVEAKVQLVLGNTSTANFSNAGLWDPSSAVSNQWLIAARSSTVGFVATAASPPTFVRTNTSSQVQSQVVNLGDANVTISIVTHGWRDTAGRGY
jgi:hypothetical protein